MKKLVILSLLLAAGLTAYPQSASRSKESKSRSSSSVSKSSNSRSKSSASKSSSSSKPKATQSRSSSSASRSKATQSRSSNSSRPKATQSRSSSSNRSQATQARSNNANRSQATQSRSNSSSRSQGTQSRSSSANRSQATQSRSNSQDRPKASSRTSSASRSVATKSVNSNSGRSSGSASRNSAVRSKSTVNSNSNRSSAVRSGNSSGSSFNRENRQGNKVYVRRDGNEFRHQNDEVFAKRRYKVDYRNSSDLRRSDDFRRVYRDYERWHTHRYRRDVVVYNYYRRPPLSLEIRRVRYPYRRPVHVDLCWTPWLHNQFMYYYPMHTRWNNDYGSYIETVSSYDAQNYAGSVKRVYGKVEEVYYSEQDKTYTLYFGAEFPYHDFSVVIPRRVAKNISWSPSWHFENEYVWVVGLVDIFEGKAEIVLHDEDQIRRY